MTETAQPSADTALPSPSHALLVPPLIAMAQDLVQLLPPTSVVHALQAQQFLQQMGKAVHVLELLSLGRLLQAMEGPLQAYTRTDDAPAEKSGELLQLAARDAHGLLLALHTGTAPAHQDLFPSYRALTKLGGKDTAHPADLWTQPWTTPRLPPLKEAPATVPSAALRAQLDQHVLALLQTGDPTFCSALQQLSLGLAAHAQDATSWQLVAAWLEAIEYGLLELDIYAKRLASRLLTHYASFAKGDETPPTALVRDLLFFCSQAIESAQQRQQSLPPLLAHVHQHWQPTCPSATDEPAAAASSAAFVLETPPPSVSDSAGPTTPTSSACALAGLSICARNSPRGHLGQRLARPCTGRA